MWLEDIISTKWMKEGIYLGKSAGQKRGLSSQGQYSHALEGLEFFDSRIEVYPHIFLCLKAEKDWFTVSYFL